MCRAEATSKERAIFIIRRECIAKPTNYFMLSLPVFLKPKIAQNRRE
jgi:hypothetical protein